VVSLVLLVSSFLLLVVAQFCLSSAIEHKSKTKQKKTSVKMRKVVKLRVCIKIAQYKNGLDKLENRTEQDLFLMCFNPCFLYSNIYIYI
jgi:Tfp pilus assembly protein PilO